MDLKHLPEWDTNHQQGIEQLERLYELKQQGLITFKDLNDNGYQEILSNLEILGF
jgi:hypothetical protein